jgi:YbbR domain-containing protein
VQVELPVEPTFLGQPPEGYTFYGARVSPERVTVEGPSSQLAPLTVLRTNPIRLDNRTEPFTSRVTAVPADSYVRMLDPRPLEVRVDVDASPVERTFESVPVVLRGGTGGDAVEPATVRVVLSGPPQLIDGLAGDQVAVIADVTDLPPGSEQEVTVDLDLSAIPPDGRGRIDVKSIDRRQVKVRVAEQVI